MGVGVFAGCKNLESVTLPASLTYIGLPDNHQLFSPGLLFDGCDPQKLTVYYQGTQEAFDKIHFNNPWGSEENNYFDQEQYNHVKSYIRFAS